MQGTNFKNPFEGASGRTDGGVRRSVELRKARCQGRERNVPPRSEVGQRGGMRQIDHDEGNDVCQ